MGRNGLGNIAIDDISIAPGVCPTAPQVAATGPGDCSFEDDECGWSNPERRDAVDELEWERKTALDGGRFPLTVRHCSAMCTKNQLNVLTAGSHHGGGGRVLHAVIAGVHPAGRGPGFLCQQGDGGIQPGSLPLLLVVH